MAHCTDMDNAFNVECRLCIATTAYATRTPVHGVPKNACSCTVIRRQDTGFSTLSSGLHLLHELGVAARDGRQLLARKGERLLLLAGLHQGRELAPPHLEQHLRARAHDVSSTVSIAQDVQALMMTSGA
jgi:hypothetical protein